MSTDPKFVATITVPFELARHSMQGKIRYLDPANVIATRQTETPHNRSRSGYGSKIPTSWQIRLTDKQWRRVYVVCWSNSGSAYICTKAGCLYLGAWEPKDFLIDSELSNEGLQIKPFRV